jgi:hypothetical protein
MSYVCLVHTLFPKKKEKDALTHCYGMTYNESVFHHHWNS